MQTINGLLEGEMVMLSSTTDISDSVFVDTTDDTQQKRGYSTTHDPFASSAMFYGMLGLDGRAIARTLVQNNESDENGLRLALAHVIAPDLPHDDIDVVTITDGVSKRSYSEVALAKKLIDIKVSRLNKVGQVLKTEHGTYVVIESYDPGLLWHGFFARYPGWSYNIPDTFGGLLLKSIIQRRCFEYLMEQGVIAEQVYG